MLEPKLEAKVDPVARCLANQSGRFISAEAWAGDIGQEYRRLARRILITIRNYDNGVRSGGLPPIKERT